MTHRVIFPAEQPRMPWKNGGGRTTEIASHPPGADYEEFVWRASIADVERDGAFSRFPGVDRILVLLSGNGMVLSGSGEPVVLRVPLEPVALNGDIPVECGLLDGPTRDFNLMVRRNLARGAVTIVRHEAATIAPAHFVLCLAVRGTSECLFAGHAPVGIADGQALLVEGREAPRPLHVNPVSAGAIALVGSVTLQ